MKTRIGGSSHEMHRSEKMQDASLGSDLPSSHHKARWTPAMDAYLSQQYGRLPVRTLSRRLKKSRRAIEHRTAYLGLTKRSDEYGYTVQDIVEFLGTSWERVSAWINKGWLSASRRNSDRPRDFWLVTPLALRRFLLAHSEEIDLAKVQDAGGKQLLFDLLVSSGHGAGEFGDRDRERGDRSEGKAGEDIEADPEAEDEDSEGLDG